jgi:hypothetical protein
MHIFKKIIIFLLIITSTYGCSIFNSQPHTVIKTVVVPADEYIVPQVYTNRYGDVIKGYFVPASKMDSLNRKQKELEFFHSPEYFIYSKKSSHWMRDEP